jgi:hypothetical protein
MIEWLKWSEEVRTHLVQLTGMSWDQAHLEVEEHYTYLRMLFRYGTSSVTAAQEISDGESTKIV